MFRRTKSNPRYHSDSKWIGLPVTAARLVGGESLIQCKTDGRVRVISDELLRLLQETDRIRSLNDHVELSLAKGRPRSLRRTIYDALSSLASSGLLVSEEQILNALSEDVRGDSPADGRIETLSWPTKDRPGPLLRGIRDWARVCRKFSRSPRFLVCDQSGNSGGSDLAQMLAPVAEESGVEFALLDRRSQAEAINRFVRAGIGPDTLRFGLTDEQSVGVPYGVNRNWILLATAGETFLSADDDTVCQFAVSPHCGEGLRYDPSPNPVDYRFFADRQEVFKAARFVDEDPLLVHERVLGKRPGDLNALWGQQGHQVSLDRLSPALAESLLIEAPRVRVSTTGTCGESGLMNPRLVLHLDGPLRKQLSHKQDYERAIVCTEIISGAKETTVVRRTNFVSMCFAADNRDFLPPMLPSGRGEDTLWGVTLPICNPGFLAAHVPRAVLHLGRSRTLSRADATDYRLAILHVMQSLAASFPSLPTTASPEKQTRRLGQYFVDLGTADWGELEYHLRHRWLRETAKTIDYLESLLLIHNREPANWAADVDAHIESLHRYAVSDDLAIPVELRAYADGRPRPRDEACRLLQDLVRKYGELLMAWPDIVSVAKELKAAEQFPMTRLG